MTPPTTPESVFSADPIPARAGVGLRHAHLGDFVEAPPREVAWVEVHTENYMSEGGPRLRALEAIRRNFPLSCHGVGLSLGSAEGLDRDHLARIRRVIDRFQPGLVSEHVSWSVTGGVYLNDLLPLPYTEEALAVICRNIDHAQDALGRQILVENPSSYVRFAESTMPEWAFMAEIPKRTGCGLLLDVNNIHVSAVNHAFDAEPYLDAIPLDRVQEVHIAGHCVRRIDEASILIDDHGSPVADAVWLLFKRALERLGPIPTLMEWDTNVPELPVLLAEAQKAQALLDRVAGRGVGHAA
ncbi:MAG: DUF692 family protein [Alphaproteobacteria bacterium]|jgi:uncharacterized protein (UPF0276 family)|nr:DUF692 family protein [Alphaproteobacteria bacterium]